MSVSDWLVTPSLQVSHTVAQISRYSVVHTRLLHLMLHAHLDMIWVAVHVHGRRAKFIKESLFFGANSLVKAYTISLLPMFPVCAVTEQGCPEGSSNSASRHFLNCV